MNSSQPILIDLHSHLLPERLPVIDASGFPVIEGDGDDRRIMIDGEFFRAVDRNAFDIVRRIEMYEAAGVHIQVVCTVPVMFSYHLPAAPASKFVRFLNDDIAAQQQRFPDRVIALGSLPLQDTELAINEAEHLAHDLGICGIQIGSNINNRNLDDPELFEVFSACQDLGLAILVHPWNMMGKEFMPDYWLPWLVGMPAELSRAICSMIFGWRVRASARPARLLRARRRRLSVHDRTNRAWIPDAPGLWSQPAIRSIPAITWGGSGSTRSLMIRWPWIT